MIDEQAAVVLADYEKGAITPAVARAVIDRCRQRGIPCVVDPKKPISPPMPARPS